jgi:predicted negative regulator of RcsB-dependent stress response
MGIGSAIKNFIFGEQGGTATEMDLGPIVLANPTDSQQHVLIFVNPTLDDIKSLKELYNDNHPKVAEYKSEIINSTHSQMVTKKKSLVAQLKSLSRMFDSMIKKIDAAIYKLSGVTETAAGDKLKKLIDIQLKNLSYMRSKVDTDKIKTVETLQELEEIKA